MRAIRFRAWDTVERRMLYYPEFLITPIGHIITPDIIDVKWLNTIKKEGFVGIGYTERFILMASTGLKDRNGKEIYEGDIIQHQDVKQVIRFERLDAADDADFDSYGYHINPHWRGDYVVIGNIYENPELMEVK